MSLFYQGKHLAVEEKKNHRFRNKFIAVSCSIVALSMVLVGSISLKDEDIPTIASVSSYSKEDEAFSGDINPERLSAACYAIKGMVDDAVEVVAAVGADIVEPAKAEIKPSKPVPIKEQDVTKPKISVEEYIEKFYTVSPNLSIDELEVLLDGIENEGGALFGDNEVFREFINKEKKNLSNAKKLDFILQDYGITKEQFIEVAATVLAEAASNYEDQYHVTSTMLNRLCNTRWTGYISQLLGEDKGDNLYYQVTCPGQFTAYRGELYYQMIDLDLDKYQAVLDCLASEEASHNYLSFKSYEVTGSERLAPNGNYYHEYFDESERKERKHYMVEEEEDLSEDSSDELEGMLANGEKIPLKPVQYVKS